MKNRFSNYLIVAANIITFIGLVVALFMFLQLDQGDESTLVDKRALVGNVALGYIPMIVCCVISTILLAIHQFYILKELKYRIFHVDPKLARIHYYAPFVVLINIIVSFLLFVVIDEIGLSNYIASDPQARKLALK